MAAVAAQKVVLRCEDAKETRHLDLSECALMSVPNAIYMLLSATPPTTCNLSNNDIKKIPVKLCSKFPAIRELRARENQFTSVPDQVGELEDLKVLDVGGNQITEIPTSLYRLPHLEELILDNNVLRDIDVDELMKMTSLRRVSITNNPLRDDTRARLEQCARFSTDL